MSIPASVDEWQCALSLSEHWRAGSISSRAGKRPSIAASSFAILGARDEHILAVIYVKDLAV